MSDPIGPKHSKVLADLVRRQAHARPEKTAFIFEDQEISYGALNTGANKIANGLVDLGVQPDERVVYLGKNSPEYFELLMGVSKAGAVTCPVNWRLAPTEISYIVNDTRARCLFVGAEFAAQIADLKSALPNVQHVFIVAGNHKGFEPYEAWRDAQSDREIQIDRSFDDDALQLYTSGTTGHPKGAVLSNRALIGLRELVPSAQKPEWNRWTSDDVSLVAMPCFHIGGTGWGISGLAEGATGIVMREFDPLQVLGLIDQYKISKIFMVPAAMKIVVEQPEAATTDFSSVKYMLYGASPIPLDLLKTCMDVFKSGFVQMYGMTETAGTIVALPPEDHDPAGNARMRSAGKAMDGVEVIILAEDGREAPRGQVGEIAARTMANMSSYWNLPDATATTLDADGWLRTGDAGYMDEDGYIYIHDRVKDMIISGGENIYPAEVENAIFGHPKIADVAVIGVPDQKWGEAVKAIIVPIAGEHVVEADVIAWARDRIAGFKCPKSVDFVDALPRNPSGKILKKELRAPYWGNKTRAVN
ncbi:MAG: fatty acid--CoA ligase [Pseudomonadota bacterium]